MSEVHPLYYCITLSNVFSEPVCTCINNNFTRAINTCIAIACTCIDINGTCTYMLVVLLIIFSYLRSYLLVFFYSYVGCSSPSIIKARHWYPSLRSAPHSQGDY